MTDWHSELYARKDAQVFVDVLEDCFHDCESFDDFLEMVQNHEYLNYSFCRFVLSDFEADFLSEVSYLNDVHALIDYEKNPANYEEGEELSEACQQALEAFATSLVDRMYHPHRFDQFDFSDLPEWCEHRRSFDPFAYYR